MELNTRKIKIAMANNEISLTELSKEVDISYNHLSNVINGHSNTSRRTIKLIALALNVEVDEIFASKEVIKWVKQ